MSRPPTSISTDNTSPSSSSPPPTSSPTPQPESNTTRSQRPRPASLLHPPATIVSPPSPIDPRQTPMFGSPGSLGGSPFSSPAIGGAGGFSGPEAIGSGGGGGGGSGAGISDPWTPAGGGAGPAQGYRRDSLGVGVVEGLRRQTLGENDDTAHGRPPVSRQTTTSSSFSLGSGSGSQPGSPHPPAPGGLAATYLTTSPLLSPALHSHPGPATPGAHYGHGLGIATPGAGPGAGPSSRPSSPRPSSPHFRPRPLGHRRESSTHRVRETLSGEERVQEGMRMVNQYRIGRSLGQGGYATVELGVDVGTGQEYAVKEFSKSRLHYQALQAKHRQSTRTRTRGPPPLSSRSPKPAEGGGKRKATSGTVSPDTPDEGADIGRAKDGDQKQEEPSGGAKEDGQKGGVQQKGAEGGRAGPWSTKAVDREGKDDPLGLIRREIAVMKKLDHPNLVHLYEAISVPTADSLFLVLEYMSGGVVMKVPMGQGAETAQPPYEEEQAKEYFRQLCLGLEYLHANGVVHRDVKPDNILLSADKEVVKLCDFGVSEMFLTEGDDRIKKSGGSPAFLSPESFMSQNSEIHGKAVDMWALGVTLYCLIAGRLPWSVHTAMELYDVVRTVDPPLHDDWDPDLKHLITRLLDRNPETRAQMDEVRSNPWVTSHGAEPMISREDNLYYVGRQVEEPTEHELAGAIGTLKGVFTVIRAVQKMRRLGLRRRSQTSSPATPGRGVSSPGGGGGGGHAGSEGSPEVLSLGAARMAHDAGARVRGAQGQGQGQGLGQGGHGRPPPPHQSSVDSYVSAVSLGSMGSSTGEGGRTETSGTTADAEGEADEEADPRPEGEGRKNEPAGGVTSPRDGGAEEAEEMEEEGSGEEGQVGAVIMDEPMDMDDEPDVEPQRGGSGETAGEDAGGEGSGRTVGSGQTGEQDQDRGSRDSRTSAASDTTASHRPSRLKEQLGDYRAPPSPEKSRSPRDRPKVDTAAAHGRAGTAVARQQEEEEGSPTERRATLGINTRAKGEGDEEEGGEQLVESPVGDEEVQMVDSPTDV